MSYFIYNPETYARAYTKNQRDIVRTSTERSAKAQLTKLKLDKNVWKVVSSKDFYDNEPMVEVKNLLSGKPVMIRISERGGCCDPSTERFHSM